MQKHGILKVKKLKIHRNNNINFTTYNYPKNYKKIDNYLLRSAQPEKDEILFLKNNEHITDIINYRTLSTPNTNFIEADEVKKLNINYYHIPSVSNNPEKEKVFQFLDYMDEIKSRNGKCLHHCKLGADRTGFYSLIYKVLNGIDNFDNCVIEMLEMGYIHTKYPQMLEVAKKILNEISIK